MLDKILNYPGTISSEDYKNSYYNPLFSSDL